MKAIDTLIHAGYDVALVHRDGLDMVEARRTDQVSISVKVAGELVKEVLRNQDEAVLYMREQLRPQWYREASGLDGANEFDQAIAIHELMLSFGVEHYSDGTTPRDNIDELQGIASQAGAGKRSGCMSLSPAASGRLKREPVRSGKPAALEA